MNAIIKKIHEEINGQKREDVLQFCEQVLNDNFEETATTLSFFKLPLEIIFSVISKQDFSDVENIDKLIQAFIKNTINAHEKEKETIFLLHHLNTKDCYFSLEQCVNILSSFKNVDLCTKLGRAFAEEYKDIDFDFEFQLQQKDKEIEELKRKILCELKFPPIKERPVDFQPDIFTAAKEGKLTSVQYIIEHEGIDKNLKDKYGETPLHIACRYGYIEIVEYLIEKAGANKEEVNGTGWTPLHYSASGGNLNIIQYLIEKAHVSNHPYDRDGKTPLHIACSFNHLPIVKYFVNELHYNVNESDKNGRNPLHIAAQNEFLDIIQFLLSCNADITLRNNSNQLPIDLTFNEKIRKLLTPPSNQEEQ